MSHSISQQQLQVLLTGYLSIAKSEISDDAIVKIQAGLLQQYLGLVTEVVPLNHLVDKPLIQHALHLLVKGYTVEETIMQVFTLHVFKLTEEGSGHPLERGIIKQNITSLLPIFDNAKQKKLIRAELFDKNANALLSIAEQSAEMNDIMAALQEEYSRRSDDKQSS